MPINTVDTVASAKVAIRMTKIRHCSRAGRPIRSLCVLLPNKIVITVHSHLSTWLGSSLPRHLNLD